MDNGFIFSSNSQTGDFKSLNQDSSSSNRDSKSISPDNYTVT